MEAQAQEQMIAKAQFELMKLTLSLFIKSQFNPCDGFINALKKCETELEVKTLFRKYYHDVYEQLGGDPQEAEELMDEVHHLERDVRDLESEVEDWKDKAYAMSFIPDTLDAEYKLQALREYGKQYTAWELEDLLKNGKEYLKK